VIRVTLLTRPDCHHCDDARRILGRLAEEYPLQLDSMDVESPAGQELALSGGLLFPPGIVIDERPFSYGRPSEGRLRRELERLAGSR
jgi:glutaredoxin